MDLTTAQLQTLKTDINANQSANAAAGNYQAIAAYYNANGTGAIWKPSIDVAQMNAVIDWSAFAGLTVAKQNTYLAMITAGFVDATSSTIRTGFQTVFGVGSTSLNNLTTLAQRTPTRFESLFTTSQVCSLYGQACTVNDVINALAL